MTNTPITEFKDELAFLSNFHPAPITLSDETENITWATSEHKYQYEKSGEGVERYYIRTAPTPGKAKRIGNEIELVGNWDVIRERVMYETVQLKFTQNLDLGKKLVETGDKQLTEGNHWHDNFWGDCLCSTCKDIEGQNKLGKIIMTVREELKKTYFCKVHWYCAYFVGVPKWQSTEIYEPDDCETEFTTIELLEDWNDEIVTAPCPRCKNDQYQDDDHPEKELFYE